MRSRSVHRRSPGGVDATQPPSTLTQMQALIGDRRGQVVVFVLCSIAISLTEAGILAVIAEVAAALVKRTNRVTISLGLLHLHAPVVTMFEVGFAFVVIRFALQVPLIIIPSRICADVQARMRKNLFHAFTRASWDVQSRDREGHLQETMTSQVLQATGASMQAMSLVGSFVTFLVLMLAAVALNPVAAGVVLFVSLLMWLGLRPLRALGVRRARELSQAQMEFAGGLGESIRLAEETQVFGVGGAQRDRGDRLITAARDLFYLTQMVGRWVGALYQSVVYVLLVAGLYALYETGKGHVTSIGVIVLLLYRAANSGQVLQACWQSLRQSLPFVNRLQNAEQRYVDSRPFEGDQPLPVVQSLAFENVSFAYRPGQPVLSDVSFEVARGEAVGVIGPSGAGKSTLIQILLQLRTAKEGRYLVNGVPVEQFSREDWHRQVAYVPQEPRLLHASVAANIRYFRTLDDDAVERAGRLAGIHDEIMGFSDGYETVVGPRADAVSGGQQQRICLARALAARPEVLVLDEPTSALDPHSETLIQESLTALKNDITIFIIAHRMSTLDICARVMVIIDGRLVAFDTAALLQEQNSYYRSATRIATGALGGGL